MNNNPHYFFAVKLPDSIKQRIHDELCKIENIFPFKRFVHQSDYHITLTFLGAVEEKKLQSVINLVDDALQGKKGFPLKLTGFNFFGNKESPRIFWVAVNEKNELFELQATVHEKCLEAGFTLESRSYNPHITVARKWDSNEKFDQALLERYNPFLDMELEFYANEVVLYKTNIEKTPKYEPIVSFPLK